MAWPWVQDDKLVQRSDMIVLAHVKDGSPRMLSTVPRGFNPPYQLTLEVTDFLKGKSESRELTVVLHRELAPVINGYWNKGWEVADMRVPLSKEAIPANSILIYEVNDIPGAVSLTDARQDQLWFLRRGDPEQRGPPTDRSLGVSSGQDIQPAELKTYYLAFLSDDPPKRIEELAKGNSALAQRSRDWLDHLEVEKICTVPDLPERARKLVTYFIHHDGEPRKATDFEVTRHLWECGFAGAEVLRPYVDAPGYTEMQRDILSVWTTLHFPDAVPVLIGHLEKEEKFWASQDPAEIAAAKARRDGKLDAHEMARIVSYAAICDAAEALIEYADPRSRPILETTLRRWGPKEPETSSGGWGAAYFCREALAAIDHAAAVPKAPSP